MSETENGDNDIAKLLKKLSDIQNAIGLVKPEGHNKHSNFKYITNQQMSGIMAEQLPKHKVFIVKNLIEAKSHGEIGKSKTGNSIFRAEAIMRFDIYDIETGCYIQVPFSGCEQDAGGKQGQQAVTEAVKRFYFKLFDVTEGEEDPDSKSDPVSATKTKQPPKTKPTNPSSLKFSDMPEEIRAKVLSCKMPTDQAEHLYRAMAKKENYVLAVLETYDMLKKENVEVSVNEIVKQWKACDWNDSNGHVTKWVQELLAMSSSAMNSLSDEDKKGQVPENAEV